MPPAELKTDPELLLRDAVSGVAVAAYSRGISLTVHVDNRLPGRVAPRAADLAAFLRRGLLRTVEAGHGSKIALALWLDEAAPEGGVKALLEVCRALDSGNPPVSRLADIWALPLGGRTARPVDARRDAAAESVLIPLAFESDPAAPPVGARWGAVFRGRRLLHARDILFDRARLKLSMAEIGAKVGFAATLDEAMAALREGVAAGRSFDVVVIDGNGGILAAVELARQIRAEPELEGTSIVLASAPRAGPAPGAEAGLFDVVPWVAVPWRRLLDVLHDLFRRQAAGAGERRSGSPARTGGGAVPMLAGRRILVAEDVATNQVLLQAVLSHTGAAIEVVPDGAAVVARHRAEPADLIVMDLQMPGMGGIAALRAVRALGGPAGAVPVIALTAYARSSDREKALEAGMDAYLAKPIILEEFYELLRRLLPPGGG